MVATGPTTLANLQKDCCHQKGLLVEIWPLLGSWKQLTRFTVSGGPKQQLGFRKYLGPTLDGHWPAAPLNQMTAS